MTLINTEDCIVVSAVVWTGGHVLVLPGRLGTVETGGIPSEVPLSR